MRLPVPAGPHDVGVTFFRNPAALVEQVRLPFQNPRRGGAAGPIPIVASITVTGPYNPRGAGETSSRARIFTCRPAGAASGERAASDEETRCAARILSSLARLAYRRPMTDDDLDTLLGFYADERAAGGSFEAGIELALRWLLASPDFLFRVEAPPPDLGDAAIYRISDLELASRLSFFLWSSIPDDELLRAAEAGRLRDSEDLERQVRRMLADPRANALTNNFAGQWLQLRNLADTAVRPGDPYSLAFDESLRRGMIRETERFFDSIVRENRAALELLTADYTFLNERVATHYGVPNVQGSHFRRVALPAGSPRRGLLGHGSILTLTLHAIRTSPVLRGKWILNNILGTPPPDPPPNVPALVDRKTQAKTATLRKRMQAHRDNPACAACHAMIDPAGFALENFDAIGRWRVVDESFNPIDASGVLPDGTAFDGVAELRAALVRRPERFVTTMTEKLLTYALGRGLTHADMPHERDPRVVFQRMFGDGGSVAARLADMRKDRSILDATTESLRRLERRLGAGDRTRVGEYLDTVRDVERRIQRAEENNASTPLPELEQPAGVPDGYAEHLSLLYDLLALAWQADVTRVSCTQVAREQSGRTYPEIGVPEAHHTVSHHQTDPHNVAQYTKINVFQMSLFAKLVEKLRATPDGDGALLDHCILVYRCGMGDGDHHTPFDLPVALVGGGVGRLAGNRHLKYPLHTPFMNLGLSLLEKVDVVVERIADSTGRLAGV